MTATTTKLQKMLTENTGVHMLDSGGAYGRHWQRNQGADFARQPVGRLEVWTRGDELDILVTLSVYHWLAERLEYNPELDEQYRQWCEARDEYLWRPSAEAFALHVGGRGLYGDGPPITVNTCNAEDLLSQTIQYVYWTDDDDEAHVLLQIHGGCDVRGGYTYPVAFDVDDDIAVFENASATIACDRCGAFWDTSNGCHWVDGCWGQGQQLQDYPAADTPSTYTRIPDNPQLFVDTTVRSPNTGVVYVDNGRNAHCPYCGGKLQVFTFPC